MSFQELKTIVLQRDYNRCQQCGKETKLDVHHIFPRSCGGLDILNNLISLCRSCHKIIEPKRKHTPKPIVEGKIYPTRILVQNRISLPKEYTDQIKLGEGDFVGYFISDNKLVISPIKVEAKK